MDRLDTVMADIAFMSSTAFVQLSDCKDAPMTLLPVTSVHQHPKAHGAVGNFSDIIIHEELRTKARDFLDLRGCKWAFSNDTSVSGNLIVRKYLKVFGENPAFFGNLLPSGSHINSIKMVLERQADAAAVDANSLLMFKRLNPNVRDVNKLVVLESWGPLPPYPVAISKRLPSSFAKKIVNALLTMHEDIAWRKVFAQFGVIRFDENDAMEYEAAKELLRNNSKNPTLQTIYY